MISAPLSWKPSSTELAEAPNYAHAENQFIPPSSLAVKLQQHRALGSPLVSIDLHPLEQNFFLGQLEDEHTRLLIGEYYKQMQSSGARKTGQWLINQLSSLSNPLERLSKSKVKLVEANPQRLRFYQCKEYDYYQELILQYQQLFIQQPEWSKWIFSIQGLHSLGVGYPENAEDLDANHAAIKSRIRQLKGEEPLDGGDGYWQHSPWAFALAGHFHNTYCGQASSLPEVTRLLYDQRSGKDLGFLREGTYDIIYELLGLDQELRPTGSRRILIDVRHMSPAARKAYYQHVVARFNNNAVNRHSLIPIVATQVGFSGIDSLDAMIRHASEGREKDNFRSHGFLSWGYNLSDEDVIAIFNSHGLINIANDRRLLGEDDHWINQLGLKALNRHKGRQLLKRTLEQFVRIPFDYFLTHPLKIWDIISFCPSISPAETTATEEVLSWETAEEDLLKILNQLKLEEPILFGNYRPEDLVRKICSQNLERILKS